MSTRPFQYPPLQLLLAQMDRSARFFPRSPHPPVIPPAQRRRAMHSSPSASSFSNVHALVASPPLPSQYPVVWSNAVYHAVLPMSSPSSSASPDPSTTTLHPGDFSDLPFVLDDLAGHHAGSYAPDDVYDPHGAWSEKVSVAAAAPPLPLSPPLKHDLPSPMYTTSPPHANYYDGGYDDPADGRAQPGAVQLSPLQAHHVFFNHPHMASVDSDMSDLYRYGRRGPARGDLQLEPQQQPHQQPQQQQHVVPAEFFSAQPELDLALALEQQQQLQYPASLSLAASLAGSSPEYEREPAAAPPLEYGRRVPFPLTESPSPPAYAYASASPGLTGDEDEDGEEDGEDESGESEDEDEEDEDADGDDGAYDGGVAVPGGVRRLPRRSRTHSHTSCYSDSGAGAGRRRRPSRVAQPVPVPNLTKKSRGRRVPTGPVIVTQGGVQKDLRTYRCEVDGCGKRFARGEHLKRHVRSIHTNEKPHQCPAPGCGKQFSRHDNLGQHMRVHKGRYRDAEAY